jgi:hypothetical protein
VRLARAAARRPARCLAPLTRPSVCAGPRRRARCRAAWSSTRGFSRSSRPWPPRPGCSPWASGAPPPPLPYLSPYRSPYCMPVAPRHHAGAQRGGTAPPEEEDVSGPRPPHGARSQPALSSRSPGRPRAERLSLSLSLSLSIYLYLSLSISIYLYLLSERRGRRSAGTGLAALLRERLEARAAGGKGGDAAVRVLVAGVLLVASWLVAPLPYLARQLLTRETATHLQSPTRPAPSARCPPPAVPPPPPPPQPQPRWPGRLPSARRRPPPPPPIPSY